MAKERVGEWVIAAVLAFAGGVVIPSAGSIILGLVTVPLLGMGPDGMPVEYVFKLPYAVFSSVLYVGFFWFGARYVSQYLKGKYEITRPDFIALLSVLYISVSNILMATLFGLFSTSAVDSVAPALMTVVFSIAWVIELLVFYRVAKKELAA